MQKDRRSSVRAKIRIQTAKSVEKKYDLGILRFFDTIHWSISCKISEQLDRFYKHP